MVPPAVAVTFAIALAVTTPFDGEPKAGEPNVNVAINVPASGSDDSVGGGPVRSSRVPPSRRAPCAAASALRVATVGR